ncbi:MAG: Tex-like N-terminal domain-containing protein [bacterium]
MEIVFPIDLGRIAQDLQIRKVQVESVVQLLDEGNTVPFITRYRKERTGSLNEVQIREIEGRIKKTRDLNERKQTILKAIDAQGKLTEDLREAIRITENPKKLEDIYLPYKPKKRSKATEAREKGFEPLALRVWNRDDSLLNLNQAAVEFLNPEKGIENVEQVHEGVKHILAEAISELSIIRDSVRKLVWRIGRLTTSKVDGLDESKGQDYRDYFSYSEPIQNIPPHRILAFNRGEKEHVLKVRLDVNQSDFEKAILGHLPLDGHPQADIFREAALDALDRLLKPSIEREVRRDISETAEKHAVEVFARNLRSLLLQPPITPQVTLAIDPGFRTGCKVVVIDELGNVLEHTVIYPHAPQNRRHEAKLSIKELVGRHRVQVVAIGNGTACRETEELIAEIISEGTAFQEAGITPENYVPPQVEEAPITVDRASDATPSHPAPDETNELDNSVLASEDQSVTNSDTASFEAVSAVDEPTPPPISGGAPEGDEETVNEDTPDSQPASKSSEKSFSANEIEATSVDNQSIESQTVDETSSEEGDAPNPEPQVPTAVFSGLTSLPKGMEVKEPEKPKEKKEKERSEKRERTPRGPKPQPPQAPLPPTPHVADPYLAKLRYVIVNESGASVYSTSNQGREEFPDYDATLRGVISIGRRLLDPLAELVKIDPQSVGVGLYQHDVGPKTLKESLESVVESCVNFVGVDLNTASVPLLRHVAGLNQLTARRIFEKRQEKGPYSSRDEVQQIEGVGPVTFTQAAGFLRIRNAANPLDDTWVHPESYEVAAKLLESLGYSTESLRDKEQLAQIIDKLGSINIEETANTLNVGVPTLTDICAALSKPGRDPREDLPKPIFKRGILKLEDLQPGMELKGTVLNVVDFGAFVDIGLKDSGLVHISQLANRYIKSPHDVVSVGDVVSVWVMGVDNDRKRVSLTMVAPGTEREKGRGQEPVQHRRETGDPGDRDRSRNPRLDRGDNQQNRGNQDRDRGRGPRRDGGQDQRSGERAPRDQERSRYGRGSQQSQSRSGGDRRDQSQGNRQNRPPKPQQPPKPLSEKEITGAVPLRSFGQLKQFFEKRTENDNPESPETPEKTD